MNKKIYTKSTLKRKGFIGCYFNDVTITNRLWFNYLGLAEFYPNKALEYILLETSNFIITEYGRFISVYVKKSIVNQPHIKDFPKEINEYLDVYFIN